MAVWAIVVHKCVGIVGWVEHGPGVVVRCANRSKTICRPEADSTPCATHHSRGGSLHAPYELIPHLLSFILHLSSGQDAPRLRVFSALGRIGHVVASGLQVTCCALAAAGVAISATSREWGASACRQLRYLPSFPLLSAPLALWERVSCRVGGARSSRGGALREPLRREADVRSSRDSVRNPPSPRGSLHAPYDALSPVLPALREGVKVRASTLSAPAFPTPIIASFQRLSTPGKKTCAFSS